MDDDPGCIIAARIHRLPFGGVLFKSIVAMMIQFGASLRVVRKNSLNLYVKNHTCSKVEETFYNILRAYLNSASHQDCNIRVLHSFFPLSLLMFVVFDANVSTTVSLYTGFIGNDIV